MPQNVIPSEKLTNFSTWQFESFDPVPPPSEQEAAAENSAQEDEPPIVLPTAEEIERMHEDAWKSGHESGFATGHAEGLEAGQKKGESEGHAAGFAEGREAGYAAGFAEGKEKGQAEGFTTGETAGRQQGESLANQQAEELVNVFNALQDAIRRVEQDLADDILHLALNIAKRVVREQVSSSSDNLRQIIRNAINQLPIQANDLSVILNPHDAANLRAHLSTHKPPIRLIENENISIGGCEINADSSTIDATLESRWQRSIAPLGSSESLDRDSPLDGGESHTTAGDENNDDVNNVSNVKKVENAATPSNTDTENTTVAAESTTTTGNTTAATDTLSTGTEETNQTAATTPKQ